VAAGNAHLSGMIIRGDLIEHERFVLRRTKKRQVSGTDREARPAAAPSYKGLRLDLME
jgi:hypothetical protein